MSKIKVSPMIRDATKCDIEYLLPLARKMHSTSIYKNSHYSDDNIRVWAKGYIDSDHSYFRVYCREEKAVAFLLGYITNYLWGDDIFAQEELLFTDGKSQLAGFKLLKDFEKWAIKNNCREVNYSVTYGGATTSQYDDVMERLGYTKQGTIYKKGLK
tara:strand:- start:253 stop:723 length:471 start_codon:yes stop_codon:yes gene_type:complete